LVSYLLGIGGLVDCSHEMLAIDEFLKRCENYSLLDVFYLYGIFLDVCGIAVVLAAYVDRIDV